MAFKCMLSFGGYNNILLLHNVCLPKPTVEFFPFTQAAFMSVFPYARKNLGGLY